jgi:sulfite exporter TauE/SafE
MTGGTDYIAAFLVGLLGAVHCAGMCGSIVGALTRGLPERVRRFPGVLPYLIAYNVGRVASYALAGALAGTAGAFASDLLWMHRGRLVLLALAGVFLGLMGLSLGGWWNALAPVERAGAVLWRRLQPLGVRLLPVRSPAGALLLGLLWGWLPCGLVYTVLVWSLTAGGAAHGALLMASFGAGTLPALFAMGVLATRLAVFVGHPRVRRVAGALILAFGLLTLYHAARGGMPPGAH